MWRGYLFDAFPEVSPDLVEVVVLLGRMGTPVTSSGHLQIVLFVLREGVESAKNFIFRLGGSRIREKARDVFRIDRKQLFWGKKCFSKQKDNGFACVQHNSLPHATQLYFVLFFVLLCLFCYVMFGKKTSFTSDQRLFLLRFSFKMTQ